MSNGEKFYKSDQEKEGGRAALCRGNLRMGHSVCG